MEQDFVTYDRDSLTITVRPGGKPDLVIKKENVDISYYSGGPGGQNVNRSMNGVRVIYRIPDDYRRQAFRTQEIMTRSMSQRSQEQNLHQAFEQLAHKLRSYFYVKPRRKKSKVPGWSKKKRMRDKKMHSLKKQTRRQAEF